MTGPPDLVEPVVAFRAWRVLAGRLRSPYIPCTWEGRVMHAACWPANRTLFGPAHRRGWLDVPHASPHPACQCGVYAYHRPGVQAYYGEWEWVEGVVTVWGRIEAHGDGLRAEHARVEALARPDAEGDAGRRSRIEAIAADLGCDAVRRDELRAAAATYGTPLPPSLRPAAAAGGNPG